MSVYGTIYKFENEINGKVYIGQTTRNIEKYILDHFYSSLKQENNKVFYKAIRKYGVQNFKIQVLCQCYSSYDLNWAEDFYILEWYNSVNNKYGYNMKSNHYGNNEESRRKISETVTPQIIERWKDPEYKKRLKKSHEEFNNSELRKEISRKTVNDLLSNPGKKKARDEKIKQNALTDDFKQKMSRISLEKWNDESFRKKRETALNLVTQTEEYRHNLSEALKKSYKLNPDRIKNYNKVMKEKYYNDPIYLANLSSSIKNGKLELKNDPERRKKDSENKKRSWGQDESRKLKISESRKNLNQRFDFKLNTLITKYKFELVWYGLILKNFEFFKKLSNQKEFQLKEIINYSSEFNSEYKSNRVISCFKKLNLITKVNGKGKHKFLLELSTNLLQVKTNNITRRIIKCRRLIQKIQNEN